MSEQADDEQAGLAWLAAIGAAAAAPAILAAALMLDDGPFDPDVIGPFIWVMLPAGLVALVHLALAIPLFRFMQRRGRVNWMTAALSGAVIGATPLTLILLMNGVDLTSLEAWTPSAIFAGSGLAGGLAFRAVLGPQEPAG